MSENTIGSRIRKISKTYYANTTAFANDLKISQSMVSKFCTGKVIPGDRIIADICRICNINEEWIRYGTGEMENYAAKAVEIGATVLSQMDATPDTSKKLIALLTEMPPSLYPAFSDALVKLVEEFRKNPNATYEQLIQSAYEDGFQFGFKMAQKMNNSQNSDK